MPIDLKAVNGNKRLLKAYKMLTEFLERNVVERVDKPHKNVKVKKDSIARLVKAIENKRLN